MSANQTYRVGYGCAHWQRVWRGVIRFAGVVAVLGAVLVLTSASPALAQCTITAGSDLFTTPGGGSTYQNFNEEPIPADTFKEEFGPGSDPFDGIIYFKGNQSIPAPSPYGWNWMVDTIVQRLNDAAIPVPPFIPPPLRPLLILRS
ncbi:MAG: hypothetical protein JSU63_13660 [Phycisphaerales bacterium]|nr:MAG: hypothetical protein JSU63_13660 [Phycisphaerales bacterium]